MEKLTESGACTPERERYIPNKAAELERQITELEEYFGDLQGRLQSVRSEDERGGEVAGASEEIGLPCPLAEHMRVQTVRVCKVCDRIRYQLSVLET